MRDAARQFADRLHFLRHRELFARLDQLLLRVAPFCCVTDDIGEADQFPIIVTYCSKHTGHVKRRAVLPNTPPLHLVLTLLNRQFDCAIRFAGTALVRPVQNAEVLADDFVHLVTDNLLCGAAPARNASGRVQ